jgi:hypothetical protein
MDVFLPNLLPIDLKRELAMFADLFVCYTLKHFFGWKFIKALRKLSHKRSALDAFRIAKQCGMVMHALHIFDKLECKTKQRFAFKYRIEKDEYGCGIYDYQSNPDFDKLTYIIVQSGWYPSDWPNAPPSDVKRKYIAQIMSKDSDLYRAIRCRYVKEVCCAISLIDGFVSNKYPLELARIQSTDSKTTRSECSCNMFDKIRDIKGPHYDHPRQHGDSDSYIYLRSFKNTCECCAWFLLYVAPRIGRIYNSRFKRNTRPYYLSGGEGNDSEIDTAFLHNLERMLVVTSREYEIMLKDPWFGKIAAMTERNDHGLYEAYNWGMWGY